MVLAQRCRACRSPPSVGQFEGSENKTDLGNLSVNLHA